MKNEEHSLRMARQHLAAARCVAKDRGLSTLVSMLDRAVEDITEELIDLGRAGRDGE